MLEQMQARPWVETRAFDFHAIPADPAFNPLAPHDGPRLLAAFVLMLLFAAGAGFRLSWRRITRS